jgi:hypothetical protein
MARSTTATADSNGASIVSVGGGALDTVIDPDVADCTPWAEKVSVTVPLPTILRSVKAANPVTGSATTLVVPSSDPPPLAETLTLKPLVAVGFPK